MAMPFFIAGVDMDQPDEPTLPRADVERLVRVEAAVSYLREKMDESVEEQKKLNTNLAELNKAHAVALDRERNSNRLWSMAAGMLGGLLPGFLKH